ncbi:unnamed protein product [Dracunculus medinensis]|uniref:Exostosin-2 n=1 Tax=Dracunculus medinensis TaxID=318479 RepID=A0A0N4UIH7_DRAME|nr:unnamed protein product [Dracunculus medinensis]
MYGRYLILFAIIVIFWWRLKLKTSQIKDVWIINTANFASDHSFGYNCTVDTCLNLSLCSVTDNQLTVYVEPLIDIVDQNGAIQNPYVSSEFIELREIIKNSRFFVSNIEDACIVIPGIDTLNLRRTHYGESLLYSLFNFDSRYSGFNVYLFVFLGSTLQLGKAIVARAQSYHKSFRPRYDIPIPIWLPNEKSRNFEPENFTRTYLILVILKYASNNIRSDLKKNFFDRKNLILLDDCKMLENLLCDMDGFPYSIDEAFKASEFILVSTEISGFDALLISALRFNCIPIILSELSSLPFDELINWDRISVRLFYSRLSAVHEIIKSISQERKKKYKKMITQIYNKYFSSLSKIVLTSLKIIEHRIVPNGKDFHKDESIGYNQISPLFAPRISPAEGFTAVIFPLSQVQLLFSLIHLLAKVPSLMNIIVVWNNIEIDPPPEFAWPHISRPIRVIRMGDRSLSNGFITFSDISSEAVLSLDDSSFHYLTVDQVEFGYQVWRENPDRLVSYLSTEWIYFTPSGPHSSIWPYNISISMGPVFYHKYYNILFHMLLMNEFKSYSELTSYCEKILRNLFLANITGRYPVNILVKEPFCPQCRNNRITIAQNIHMHSNCIQKFTALSGGERMMHRYNPLIIHSPNGNEKGNHKIQQLRRILHALHLLKLTFRQFL